MQGKETLRLERVRERILRGDSAVRESLRGAYTKGGHWVHMIFKSNKNNFIPVGISVGKSNFPVDL